MKDGAFLVRPAPIHPTHSMRLAISIDGAFASGSSWDLGGNHRLPVLGPLIYRGSRTKEQVKIHLSELGRIAGLGHGHRDGPYEISLALVANFFGPGWTIPSAENIAHFHRLRTRVDGHA
jgi:hypothetical protein